MNLMTVNLSMPDKKQVRVCVPEGSTVSDCLVLVGLDYDQDGLIVTLRRGKPAFRSWESEPDTVVHEGDMLLVDRPSDRQGELELRVEYLENERDVAITENERLVNELRLARDMHTEVKRKLRDAEDSLRVERLEFKDALGRQVRYTQELETRLRKIREYSAELRRMACGHEEVAVAPIGVVWMECPECHKMKVLFKGAVCDESRLHWTCACGFAGLSKRLLGS